MTVLRLVKDESGKNVWVSSDEMSPRRHVKGSDPTLDQYISKNGGIRSPVDRKIYTTKSAYLNHLKSVGKHIHE